MVLIGLLQNRFFKNLKAQKFPSPLINVRKQDLSNIRRISFRYPMIEINLTDSKELSNIELIRENILLI